MRTVVLSLLLMLAACGDDQGSGPGAELCGNGRDDDGDGFVDCADQDCWSSAACGDATGTTTSSPDATAADTALDTSSEDSQPQPTTSFTDTSIADGTSSCDTCSGLGQIKGRVCAPSEQVFVNDADVVVTGIDCDGQAFTKATKSEPDGSYWLLDVPCGTHEITITKGSFSAIYTIPVEGGRITDVTGAANKLCLQASKTKIAVLDGSYDDIAGLVTQLGFDVDLYTEEETPGAAGTIVQLLSDTQLLFGYDIVFADCGIDSGWMPQDHPEVMPSVKEFVLRGGSLYMSDYAWVYGEWAFPTYIEWVGSDNPSDMYKPDTSPQKIPSGTHSTATIVDGDLAVLLGKTTIDIVFDRGPQIAAESVGQGAFAHVVGDVNVPFELSLQDAPLAVSYKPSSSSGRVIYTNFHNDAQTTSDMLVILNYLVFSL